MIKKRYLVIFMALLIIGMSVAVATDTNDTDTSVQKDTTQSTSIEKTYKTADTIIKADGTIKNSINKKDKKNVKEYNDNYPPDQPGYWVETPDENNPYNVETHITDENKNVIFIQEQNQINPGAPLTKAKEPYNFTYYLETDFIYGKDLTYYAYPGNTTYSLNGKTLYEGIIFTGYKPGKKYYQPDEVIIKDFNIICDNDFFQEEQNIYGWTEITRGEDPQFNNLPSVIKNASITINITEENMHNLISELNLFRSSLLNKTVFENCTFNIGLPIQKERNYNDGTGTYPKIFVPVNLFGSLNVTVTNCTFNIFCISDEEDITGPDTYPCFMNMTSTDNTVNFTGNTINLNNVKGFVLNTNNAIIEDNIITTNYDYVAEITGNENIVRNNKLIAKTLQGNDAVLVTGTDNIVENNGPVEVKESEVNVTTEDLEMGETTNLTAVFYTDNNEQIKEGTAIFKINGKTLRDKDGNVIYVEITDGKATSPELNITQEWTKEETTIQAVYVGNDNTEPISTTPTTISITKPKADITITAPRTATAGENITLKATVNSGDKAVSSGRVTFKLNGKTLKDADGKTLYANVENGEATLTYKIPEKTKAKEYILKAVFTDTIYDRQETNSTLTVVKA